MKELRPTNTYNKGIKYSDCTNRVSRHLEYMVENNITVPEQQEQLPSLY